MDVQPFKFNRRISSSSVLSSENVDRYIETIQEVEANDDLLMAILIRMPPRPIFKFRCLSKRWRGIVATPFFLKIYRERKKNKGPMLVALIEKTIVIRAPSSWTHYMNILPLVETNDLYKMDTSCESLGHFISSSNGLILCGQHPNTYYVINPLTGRSVPLPPPQVYKSRVMTLVCEENSRELVPSFKVVMADKSDRGYMDSYYCSKNGEVPNTLMIETYSSETGEWATSALWVAENLIIEDTPAIVVDGIIHWFDNVFKWRLAIYDLNTNHIQLIELPSYETRASSSTTRSSRDDALWFAMNNQMEGCLKVWMLPHRQNGGARDIVRVAEWILMRSVSYISLSHDSAIFSNQERCDGGISAPSVLGSFSEKCPFSFQALIPWKPMANFALFAKEKRFYICNLETKFINMVKHIGIPTKTGSCYAGFGWHPYLEPFCLSSYAL